MKSLIKILVVSIFIVGSANYGLADEEKSAVTLEEELRWLQAEAIIFSASRSEQRVSETSAAVFVITQEDIRRSGVTSIPEALRMVPGFQVARIDCNTWAISSRGFNEELASKLLVLIDGRTVYHPFFSGVVWREKDVMLEDVERIEVIRGPGAAMWGANAVNGVINIITKNAQDTQAGLISAGAGNEEKAFGSLRYGSKINEKTFCRAYFKGFDRDEFVGPHGENTDDYWQVYRGGFRIDGELNNKDSFALHGDIYDGYAKNKENQFAPLPPYALFDDVKNRFFGVNIVGRWDRKFSDTSDMALQAYYDRTEDKIDYTLNNEKFKLVVDTFDIDFQHRFKLSGRHDFMWGLGFRFISDDFKNTLMFSVVPVSRDITLFSTFIHDEISLIEEKLKLILGSKFEKNDYTDYEVQPNARLLCTPSENQTVWGAISRAVRVPSRGQHDIRALYKGVLPPNALYPNSPMAFIQGQGKRDFDSEDLIAYELGYRVQPSDILYLDIAAFYNDYDNLASTEMGTPFSETSIASPHLAIPLFLKNKNSAETYGLELSAQWQAMKNWRLQMAYSYLEMNLHPGSGTTDPKPEGKEGESPQNQFTLRSSLDLPRDIQLDAFVRYVDDLPQLKIDSYVEADINLGWKVKENLEISFSGRNLLEASHPEFDRSGGTAVITEIERSFYGKVAWKF